MGDSVKELLHSKLGNDADQCRVMVRAYANILGLSKSMARAGITGYEARSLSSFTSSFTGSRELFDYVDAGDKEGAGFKIRGILQPDRFIPQPPMQAAKHVQQKYFDCLRIIINANIFSLPAAMMRDIFQCWCHTVAGLIV